mgnify:CR=1 FL=1
MTDATDASASALPLHVVSRADFAAWRDAQPAHVAAWTQAQGFDGCAGSALTAPASVSIYLNVLTKQWATS